MKYTLLLIVLCMFCGLSSAQVEGETAVMIDQIPFATYERDGLYGLMDPSTRRSVLRAIYRSIEDVSKNRFIVMQEDRLKGLYHGRLKKMIIPVEFDDITIHDNSPYGDQTNDTSFFAILVKNGYAGVYFSRKDSRNIPVAYDEIKEVSSTGYFIATKNSKYSLFDKQGNLIVTDQKAIAVYEGASSGALAVSSMLIQITNDQGKQGLYDSKAGRYILPVKYDQIGGSYGDLFIVEQKEKCGMVNSAGTDVIPLRYDTLAFLRSGPAITRLKAAQKNRYSLLTLKNKALTKFEYNDIMSNGPVYTVKLDDGYSLIDSTGSRITPAVYDHIGAFYQDTCTVASKNKSGYMNTKGTVISSIDKPRKGYGFTTLNELYNAFVNALKADNDAALTTFCQQVLFDRGTCEFMTRVNVRYRGVPDRVEGDHTIENAVKSYVERVRLFQEHLRKNNELQSLRFVSTDNNFDLKRMGTESRGMLSTDKHIYRFAIGELILLDNYWKAFTFPEWTWKDRK